jgi:hypothetical protein
MKKDKSKNHSDFEEFGKEFISLIPINNLQKTFRQLENFDGGTPETLLAKIKNKPLTLPKLSDEKQKSLQENFLKALRSPEYASLIKAGHKKIVKDIKDHLAKDLRYSQLINLINKADEKIEFVSLAFLMPFLDLERNFILFCKPIKILEEINNSNGEKRKNFIVDIFKEIPEPLYYIYLEVVWKLSYLAELKMFPKDTPKFGALANQSANRLKDFSGLVESRMKYLRNSFFHSNFKYNLNDDSFIVWDDNTPKTKMTADELVKIAKAVTLMCVETFPLVA